MVAEFTFFTDPGHGWLEVSIEALNALDVKPSSFSYASDDGRFVYLEEDGDMALLFAAFHRQTGRMPEVVEVPQMPHRNFIRRSPAWHGEGYTFDAVREASAYLQEVQRNG